MSGLTIAGMALLLVGGACLVVLGFKAARAAQAEKERNAAEAHSEWLARRPEVRPADGSVDFSAWS